MKNEKLKKFSAVFIALCLVLSVTLCLFPPLEVLAYDNSYSNQYYLKDLPFINNITSSKLFTQSDYLEGIDNFANISRYGEEVLKNAQDEYSGTSFFFDDVGYASFYEQVVNFFDNKSSAGSFSNAFNDIYFYSQASNTSNNYKIMNDFFTHPDNYTYYYIIYADGFSNNHPKLYIDFYISTGSFSAIAMPGSGYVFNSTQTIFNLHNCLTGDADNNSNSISLLPKSTSGGWDGSVGVDNACLYSNIPTYFAYEDNGVSGVDYSQYSNKSAIRDALAHGDSSPFLIDRRMLLSAYSGIPNYTVDNDPISQEYYGAWDIDLVPVGDVLNGSLKVKFVPSSRLNEYNSDLQIHYSFQLFFTGSKIGTGLVMTPRVKTWLVNNGFGSKTSGFSYNINSSFCSNSGAIMDNLTNDYTTFSTSNILSNIGDTGSNVSLSSGRTQNINSYYQLKLYRDLEYFSGTTLSGSGSVSYGNITTGISSNNGGISTCKLTVYAQAFYNGEEFTDIAVATYDYLTGDVVKQGTASTNNNTPTTDGVPDGLTQGYQEQIQNTIDHINSDGGVQNITGGQISGGNNSNSNNNNPTFTNNNNPTITINNNNGLTEPDGVPDDPSEGSFSMLWSIWESYHFAEWLNQDLEGNGFLHYIFSSQIWDLPIFNLIIPALAILITVSIASTIIRFIRGN